MRLVGNTYLYIYPYHIPNDNTQQRWYNYNYFCKCIIIRFEVSLLRLYELADYDVRHLEVVDLETEKKHRVIHMNYTRWPDHGMPESAIPLLQVIIHEV